MSILEDRMEAKLLLWNHYMDCCKVLGLKIDITFEEYFNKLSDDKVNQMIEFFDLKYK